MEVRELKEMMGLKNPQIVEVVAGDSPVRDRSETARKVKYPRGFRYGTIRYT